MSCRSPHSSGGFEKGQWERLLREPFRLFFSWGLLVGCLGAGLWPAFYAGWYPHWPGQPWDLHGRLMILGLGGAFVIGFLATAVPRMLGTKPLNQRSVGGLAIGHLACVLALLEAHGRVGCLLFALTLLGLLGLLTRGFMERRDLPPPGFALALLGLLCGLGGALGYAAGWDLQGGVGYRLVRLLMNEGFLLLPILGVSGYMLPRLFWVLSRQDFPDALTPSRQWSIQLLETLVVGGLIVLSLGLEAVGHAGVGVAMRLMVVLAWWARDLRGIWRRRAPSTQAWAARLGLVMLAMSWLARLIDPAHLIALEHGLFIGGFGVTLLAVAARVVDGHSSHQAEANGVSRPLRWVVWLAFLAMATRISADYLLSIQVSHYIYAALTWIALSGIWFWNWRHRMFLE